MASANPRGAMGRRSLRDDDMGYLLGLQTKDLHKLCGKLKEDRMLHVYVP